MCWTECVITSITNTVKPAVKYNQHYGSYASPFVAGSLYAVMFAPTVNAGLYIIRIDNLCLFLLHKKLYY